MDVSQAIARRRPPTAPLVAYLAVLGGLALGAALVVARYDRHPAGRTYTLALPVLAGLIAAAEVLAVRFRHGDTVDGINLVEAALAPLLFAFPGSTVVLTVAVAQAATVVVRRLSPEKAVFNVAQWTLASAAGAAVVARLGTGTGLTRDNVVALVAALVAVWVVNNTAFTLVLAVAERQSPVRLLRDLSPVILPGWVGGWFVNALLGLLYVTAYAASPSAVLLFPMPLVMLHLAYRGYVAARSERLRLDVLHRAATALAGPIDPREAVHDFLREVATGFEAAAAALVLREDDVRLVHVVRRDGTSSTSSEPYDTVSLAGALAAHPGAVRVTGDARDPLARALTDAGWRSCLAAPLLDEGRTVGALVVLDQAGLEGGSHAGEVAVLESLARETAAALAKGRLLAEVIEERHRLHQIVSTTSDGILAIGPDGLVRSWNPALARITGVGAHDVVGRPGGLVDLHARTSDGTPVDLAAWSLRSQRLPIDLRITASDGSTRRLSCSYSTQDDPSVLVVVARDVTAVDEIADLRDRFARLAAAESAQRIVVDQLQQAVMPARPDVPGVELAVSYLASDPSAPTGGDLYDWQVLPDGTLHIAVVDVLGHGVAATKDALAVVHALRTVAVDGTPLADTVARADALLSALYPDLVATVVVVRYDPATGRVRVAAGGHPPALVVTARGEVAHVAATGGAIGWPGAGSDGVAELDLGVRDALVLYTDGLVEAGKDILAGMDALVRHAEQVAQLPAEAFADELVRRALAGASRRDDTLALVLRRVSVYAPDTSRAWDVTPDRSAVGDVRREIGAWLGGFGVDTDEPGVVVSELLANAVRAARGQVRLVAEVTPDSVVVEVSDDGRGSTSLDRAGRMLPAGDAESGRGLFIVRALAREVTTFSTIEGSVVRCVLDRVTTPDSRISDSPAARP